MKTFRIVVEGDEQNAYENIVSFYVEGQFLVMTHKDGSVTGVNTTEFQISPVESTND